VWRIILCKNTEIIYLQGGIILFKVWGFFFILFASIGLFFFLVYNSILHVSAKPIPSDALQGKKVFQRQACIECHTVFGNGGYLGGDLTKIYDRTSAETLRAYMSHPPVLTGAKKKRHVQVTEQEASAIVAYLKYLNTINTLDWPLNSTKRTNSEKN
jgi:nitric oxide reductase subunit C